MKEILEHAEIVLEEKNGPFPYPSILPFTLLYDSENPQFIKITDSNCSYQLINCFIYSIANLLLSEKINVYYKNERSSYFFNIIEWFTDKFEVSATGTEADEDPLSNIILNILYRKSQGKKQSLDKIIEESFYQLINQKIHTFPKLEFCEKYLTSFSNNNPWIQLRVKKIFWGISKSLLLEIESNRIIDLNEHRKSMSAEVLYFQRYNSKFRKLLIYIEDQVYKAINRRTGD